MNRTIGKGTGGGRWTTDDRHWLESRKAHCVNDPHTCLYRVLYNLLQTSLELEVVKMGLTVLTHDCLTSCTSGSSPLRSTGTSTRSSAGTSVITAGPTHS